MLLVAAGCAGSSSGSRASSDPDSPHGKSFKQLKAENETLQARVQAMELDLAKRNADVEIYASHCDALRDELRTAKADLEYVERQFVSFEKQLTRNETKASAVAAIAEVQVLYDKMVANHTDELTDETRQEVEEKLSKTDELVKKGNFAAAAYFARRAMRILTQTERSKVMLLPEGDTRIVAVSKANVREGPGSNYGIVMRLNYGTVIVQVQRDQEWLQIRTQDGQIGWIHDSLIR